jgi:hypothetical protein
MDALEEDLEWMVAEWASAESGWSGPWRKVTGRVGLNTSPL